MPSGEKMQFVSRAFAIIADAPIPFKATEYYFEIETLDDPLETGYVFLSTQSLLLHVSFHS